MKQVSLQTIPSITARRPVNKNGSEDHQRKTPMTSKSQRQDSSSVTTVKRPSSSTSVILDSGLPERVMFRRYRHVYAGKGGWYGYHCSRCTMAAGHQFCCDKCRRLTTGLHTSRTVSEVNDSRRTTSTAEKQQSMSLCLRGTAVLPVTTSPMKNRTIHSEYQSQFQRESVVDEMRTVIGNRIRLQGTVAQTARKLLNTRSMSNRKDDDDDDNENSKQYLGISIDTVNSSHMTAVNEEQQPAELDTVKVYVGTFDQVDKNITSANMPIALKHSDDSVQSSKYDGNHQIENTSNFVTCKKEWLTPDSSVDVECYRTESSQKAHHDENGDIRLEHDDVIESQLPAITRCWSASTFTSLLSREGRQVMNEIRQEQGRTNVSPDSLFAEQERQQLNNQSISNCFFTFNQYQDDLHCNSHHSNCCSGCPSFDCYLKINDTNDDVTDMEMSRAMRKCSEWLNKCT
jgi:hypothetical protein